MAAAGIRGKFIALNVHSRKTSLKSLIQVSSIHHKKIEKDEQDESKARKRKEIIIRAEVNDTENNTKKQ